MALREPRICRPLPSLARDWRRPYYLGGFGFIGSALTLRQTALLDYDVSLRLRFGFDHLLGVPRSVAIHVRDRECMLDMRFRLPEPEHQIMALNWHDAEQADARHRSTFHPLALPVVKAVLSRLLIKENIVGGNQ
jgi:hypothetical protein